MNEIENSALDEMEQYCISRYQKKTFIKNNSFISYNQFLKLKDIRNKTNQVLVSDCFERLSTTERTASYHTELLCDFCGNLFITTLPKTGLMDAISEKYKNECPDCRNIRKKENDEAWKRRLEEKAEKEKRETEAFIAYVTPGQIWNDKVVPPNKYYSTLKEKSFFINKDYIANVIKSNMSYKEFLTTPYWKAVAQKKKQQAGYRCELCNSKTYLNVHHRTYENHGYEMDHLQDLIVLCNDCHKKFHDIAD